jgi:hypothetical protein
MKDRLESGVDDVGMVERPGGGVAAPGDRLVQLGIAQRGERLGLLPVAVRVEPGLPVCEGRFVAVR